jgi:hypothetical protein
MKHHRALVMTVLGCTLSVVGGFARGADARPPKLRAVQNVSIEDAQGKKVAPVFGVAGTSTTPIVLFQLDGSTPFVLQALPDRFIGSTTLYFATEDCFGQAFMSPYLAPEPNFQQVASGPPPGNPIYMPDPHSTPTPATFYSFFYGGPCAPSDMTAFFLSRPSSWLISRPFSPRPTI